ncbi:MAG: hypothetical protein P8127_15240 [Acidobacteriota bacterium]
MVSRDTERDCLIYELRQQVKALEEIVQRRSYELRLIQKLACAKDRLMIGSVLDGGAIREIQLSSIHEYYSMNWWTESTHFLPSSVEESLIEVWQSAPGRPVDSEASA